MSAITSAPGRFFDWATEPSVPMWKSALAMCGVLLGTGAVLFGVIAGILALTHTSVNCPVGQSLQVISYIPQTVGSVTTLQPVYGCAG